MAAEMAAETWMVVITMTTTITTIIMIMIISLLGLAAITIRGFGVVFMVLGGEVIMVPEFGALMAMQILFLGLIILTHHLSLQFPLAPLFTYNSKNPNLLNQKPATGIIAKPHKDIIRMSKSAPAVGYKLPLSRMHNNKREYHESN